MWNHSTARMLHGSVVVVLFLLVGCAPRSAGTAPSPTPQAEPPLRISGSGTALPVVQKLGEAYRLACPGARFEFGAGTNTGGAIRGLLDGTLDLAVANRPLSDSEAGEGLEYLPFARDAVVFAARRVGPVRGLTTEQVRDVFGGSVTDWAQLGGPPGTIMVLDRDEDESARKLALLPLMAGRPVQARTIVLTTARDMVASLSSVRDSLGYTSLGLLRVQRAGGVEILALDGVMPGAESVMRGSYPWHLTFALVVRGDAPSAVRRFVDFVVGRGGREVLEEYGYAVAEP